MKKLIITSIVLLPALTFAEDFYHPEITPDDRIIISGHPGTVAELCYNNTIAEPPYYAWGCRGVNLYGWDKPTDKTIDLPYYLDSSPVLVTGADWVLFKKPSTCPSNGGGDHSSGDDGDHPSDGEDSNCSHDGCMSEVPGDENG